MFPIWWRVPLFAAAASGDIPNFVVVLTGFTLVFSILLILSAVILIQGRVFTGLDTRQKAGEGIQAPEAAPERLPSRLPAPTPVVQQGVRPEVVAAIAAAVTAAADGALTVRSVAVSAHPKPLKGRGAWGLAGAIQSTEPF
jgi:Na+-transporting methylmalonyl-CoA/oxaloacetate decarboxylase gamma subunit